MMFLRPTAERQKQKTSERQVEDKEVAPFPPLKRSRRHTGHMWETSGKHRENFYPNY
jgi:hypothetical protein